MIVDKVVLITGCSSGIGKSLSHAFFQYGFKVYSTSRNLESIKDLNTIGINTLQLDVKDSKSIDTAVKYIIDKEKKIDILVNNSGVVSYGPCIELPDEDLEDMISTNFLGLVKVTKMVAPHMITERKGLIINIGSIAGVIPMPISSGYCASKAAVASWNDALRVELSPFNIKVLLVEPGPFKTDIVDKAIPKFKSIVSNPSSPYYPIMNELFTRPQTSIKNQAPVQSLTDAIMKKIFSSSPPSGHFKVGPGSISLVILSWLPTRLIDFIFSRNFGFHKLKLIIQKQDQQEQQEQKEKEKGDNVNNKSN